MTLVGCLAIIAGEGQAPIQAARTCEEQGKPYVYIALKGFADQDFKPQNFECARVGDVGAMLAIFERHQVRDVLMVGRVRRPAWNAFHFDAQGWRWVCSWGRRVFQGDHRLLELVKDKLHERGYRLVAWRDLCSSAKEEHATQEQPTPEENEDIQRGFALLRDLSPHDVGQAVTLKEGVVLGIEAAEGTQKLVKRSMQPGGILVKAPKVGQDLALDAPTVGLDTVRALMQLQARGMAITPDVMILEPEKVIALLNKEKMFLVVKT